MENSFQCNLCDSKGETEHRFKNHAMHNPEKYATKETDPTQEKNESQRNDPLPENEPTQERQAIDNERPELVANEAETCELQTSRSEEVDLATGISGTLSSSSDKRKRICPVTTCGRKYSRHHEHIKNHHPELLIKCQQCNHRGFISANALTSHVQKFHVSGVQKGKVRESIMALIRGSPVESMSFNTGGTDNIPFNTSKTEIIPSDTSGAEIMPSNTSITVSATCNTSRTDYVPFNTSGREAMLSNISGTCNMPSYTTRTYFMPSNTCGTGLAPGRNDSTLEHDPLYRYLLCINRMISWSRIITNIGLLMSMPSNSNGIRSTASNNVRRRHTSGTGSTPSKRARKK